MTEIEVKPEDVSHPSTRRVGILVGVVGIFLSVVTIASHRAHTQAVIHRTESNDQWAFYQAKKIRENTNDGLLTVLHALAPTAPGAVPGTPSPELAAAAHALESARDKYAHDAQDIMKDAQAKDAEQKIEERRALFFDIGEGLLELGLVLCSLYFMARKMFFPVLGIVASVAGLGVGLWGWML